MQNKDSVFATLRIVILVSLVCSILVAMSAVVLKARQDRNAAREKQINIVKAAGLYDDSKSISEMYEPIEAKVIDQQTGDFAKLDAKDYDLNAAYDKADLSRKLPEGNDGAGIGRVPKDLKVYLLKKEGELSKVILPIRGKGLWGMMYGFLAMEADGKTISGITFYDHKETPGLGGEIVNPKWQALWNDKKPYVNGTADIRLVKTVSQNPDVAEHQVDMLAGATLTSRGVEHTINFWLSDDGYKPFLSKLSQ